MAFDYIMYAVNACGVIGVFVNMLLIWVAYKYSPRMGLFKYILMFFAFIEVNFAIIVLVTQPVFYAYNHRLVVFSHNTRIQHSEFSSIAAGVYCAFYELWMGLVVILFMYKYTVLCKERWSQKVKFNTFPKLVLFFVYICHVTYTFVCGMIWCKLNRIPMDVKLEIKEVFNMTDVGADVLGYIVLTLLDKEGNFSKAGIIGVVDHLVLTAMMGTIIIYCGRGIWYKIQEMQADRHSAEYKRNLQIFYTLVLQASVPLVMYQVPTGLFIADALFEHRPFLTNVIPIWSLLMSIPKVIDPIIIIWVIKDYRKAVIGIVKGHKVNPESTTDSDGRRDISTRQTSTSGAAGSAEAAEA